MNKYLISVVIVASLISCSKNNKTAVSNIIFKKNVSAFKVKKYEHYKRLSFFGEVYASKSIGIYSNVSGNIKKVFVREGERVYYNTPLFTVSQRGIGIDLLDYIVRSKSAGVVGSIKYENGQAVIANISLLANVVDDKLVKIKVYAGEDELTLLKPGIKAFVKVRGDTASGYVSRISGVKDIYTRKSEIELIFNNSDKMLKSGMYVFVTIITPQKVKSIIIPQSSILFEDNIKSIYKINVETMSVVKQVVTSSKKYGEYAEVTSGLNTGDVVITKEAREVFSGCRVNFKLINLESRIKKVLTTKVFKGCIR